jgi:hypothetical protein
VTKTCQSKILASNFGLICIFKSTLFDLSYRLVRKDMDVTEHERPPNITQKLNERNHAFIAVLHFTVTGSSTMIITNTSK